MKKSITKPPVLYMSLYLGEYTDWDRIIEPIDEYFTTVNKLDHVILRIDPNDAIKAKSEIVSHLLISHQANSNETYDFQMKDGGFILSVGSTLQPIVSLNSIVDDERLAKKYRVLAAHGIHVAEHLARDSNVDIVVARSEEDRNLARGAYEGLGLTRGPSDPGFVVAGEDPDTAADGLVQLIESVVLVPEEDWTL